jgi:hypothetical protein
MSSSKTVATVPILDTEKDWIPWLESILILADQYDVREYIDPDVKVTGPGLPTEPKRPEVTDIRSETLIVTVTSGSQSSTPGPSSGTIQSSTPTVTVTAGSSSETPGSSSETTPTSRPTLYSDLNTDEREAFRWLTVQYDDDKKTYHRKREAIAKIRAKIQETVALRHHTYLRRPTCHEVMVRLRDRFKPTDYARTADLRNKWLGLCRATKVTDMDYFLQEFETTYDECLEVKLPDVQGDWPTEQFLTTLLHFAPEYAHSMKMDRLKGTVRSFTEVVQLFRTWHRNEKATKPRRSTGTAYSAAEVTADSTPTPEPTLNNRKKDGEKKDCLCGEKHAWNKCPYLFDWNRTSDFKEDPAITKSIESKKNPKLVRILESIQKKHEKAVAKATTTSTSTPSSTPPAEADVPSNYVATAMQPTTTTQSHGLYNTVKNITLPLLKSFILDTGATSSICNDRARFTDFVPASVDDFFVAGNSTAQVLGYGTVKIWVKCRATKSGKRELTLKDVAYIPSFTTSVVCYNRFHDRGTFWDTEDQSLRHNGIEVARLERIHGQWVLEYNPAQNAETSYEAQSTHGEIPKAVWTMEQAHERTGHTYGEALAHLPEASSDIKSVTGRVNPNCETCRSYDAKRLIRRVPVERGHRPFYRLCWDAIPMRDGHLVHMYDPFLGFHTTDRVHTTGGIDLLKSLRKTVNWIKTRWGFQVIILQIDGQLSLIDHDDFNDWITETGITLQVSAPDVHEQNGSAEKAGSVLTHRAAKLKASGNLPDNLWAEAYAAAAYILDRTPNRRLQWKSPLGLLQELTGVKTPQPKVAHLRAYGSRSYVLKYDADKLDRLDSKVHIGYLVGYTSTNIFRVWVPSLHTIISARDVTFDETRRYEPNDDFTDVTEAAIELVRVPGIDDIIDESSPLPSLLPQIEETTIDEPYDTIIVDKGQGTSHGTNLQLATPEDQGTSHRTNLQLATPELTPEPETAPKSHPEPVNTATDKNPSTVPTVGVSKGMDESLIISESRRSQRAPRQQAHAVVIENLHYDLAYHSAFAAGTEHHHRRLHRTELPPRPKTWNEMIRHPHRDGFLAAVKLEYSDLRSQGAFQVVPENNAGTEFVIPTRFVFTYKFDEEDYLVKHKARLVVRGDLQPKTDEDTYAATLAARVFRVMITLCAYFDLEAKQFDAVNAFGNSKLRKKIWIQFPYGFKIPGYILLLQKALYGLRISPLLWYELLCSIMKQLGLSPVPECACLFTNEQLLVFFFVDDIVVLYHRTSQKAYESFRTGLMTPIKVREIGDLKWFLGIRVVRDRDQRKIWLCQDAYVSRIAKKFNLEGRKARVPLSPNIVLQKYEGKATSYDIHLYQTKVGSIGYPTTMTRPDCARTLQKLSLFLQNPGSQHLDAVDQAIAYMNCTKTLALEFGSATLSKSPPLFLAAADASFADDAVRRWSTEGGLFQLFGGCIDWFSTLQRTVTTSSTHAELLALSHIAAWLYWWRRVFETIQLDLDTETTVYCDNLQTVRLVMKESPKLVTKLKHVDIHQHWLRQEAEKGDFKVEWISTVNMPADGLTKALGPQKHDAFVRQLNMVDIREILDRTEKP